MHVVGLYGMPRRTYRYDSGLGWDWLNQIETVGAFIIALSVLIFIVNMVVSKKRGAEAGADAWDGRSLEWSIPSPPPEYNFAEIPEVEARDDFWHRKYTEDEEGRLMPLPKGGADGEVEVAQHDGHGIHMPSPSYYPALVALGLLPLAYAAVFKSFLLMGIGAVITFFAVYAWAIEPPTEEEAGH
jgi:cytochrome c oxidase subunit 1